MIIVKSEFDEGMKRRTFIIFLCMKQTFDESSENNLKEPLLSIGIMASEAWFVID